MFPFWKSRTRTRSVVRSFQGNANSDSIACALCEKSIEMKNTDDRAAQPCLLERVSLKGTRTLTQVVRDNRGSLILQLRSVMHTFDGGINKTLVQWQGVKLDVSKVCIAGVMPQERLSDVE